MFLFLSPSYFFESENFKFPFSTRNSLTWGVEMRKIKLQKVGIGGFHAISGDTNNSGEMNKCWWTNKAS